MELSLKSYQGCLVRRPNPPAHETTLDSSPVRRPRPPAHETTLDSSPVRRPNPPAHKTTLASYPVRRPNPLAHETTLASYPVSNWGYPCSLENMAGQLFSGRALTLGGNMVTEPRSRSS